MSDPQFDPNKFAAEVVVQAGEAAAKSVGSSKALGALRRALHSITDAYAPFLEKTYRRVSSIRTFLKPSESVDLLDAYVPVDVDSDGKTLDVDELLEGLRQGGRYIIDALAGRGKSVLMRYLAVAIYHNPQGKIPLFLELRGLNTLTTKEILPYVHAQYKGESSVKFDDFVRSLKSGYFILILDGFDEVSPPDRDSVEAQILDIAEMAPQCPIIVSGRHDERFYSWEPFTLLNLKPMRFDQTRNLIERANYEEKVKKNFLRRMDADFFEKHESFLNTPLLAIMLMITFEEYAEIPHSLHEFYRNAFDTLVRRHDALKSQFLRKTHSGCTAEEIKRIFSSFCVLTYTKSAFSFNRDDGIKYAEKAIKQQGASVDAEKFLDDLIESVCLLQQEGFDISFVHRSFQEYFCAVFVASAPSGFVQKYLEESNIRIHDDVLPMLYGISPERVEDEWANEAVEAILKKYPRSNKHRAVDFQVDRMPRWALEITDGPVYITITREHPLNRTVSIIRQFYPEEFQRASLSTRHQEQNYDDWMERVVAELQKLEATGKKSLQGLSKAISKERPKRSAFRIFEFDVDRDFESVMQVVYNDRLDADLKALESIRRMQLARKRSGSQFLDSIFGDD